MLKIDITLVPFGLEEFRKQIASITIANDGTGNQEVGNYNIEFSDGVRVRVEGHRRADDIFTLLYLALQRRHD